jgi:hypothetical protein
MSSSTEFSTALPNIAVTKIGLGILTQSSQPNPTQISEGVAGYLLQSGGPGGVDSWVDPSSLPGGGVSTVGAFSGSGIANGASISGSTITFGPATSSTVGMVSTGAQSINGAKTFLSTVNIAATNELRYQDSTGGEYSGFKAPSTISVSHTYTLPNALPAGDRLLQSDSSGNLSWVTAGGGGISNGGNTTGADIVIGTNDAFGLNLETNGTNRVLINSSGNVSIDNELRVLPGSDLSTTGAINNVATTNRSFFRYTGAGVATVSGFADGSSGKMLTIYNAAAATTSILTLSSEDALSTAANRIITFNGSSLRLGRQMGVTLMYDATASRWRVISVSGDVQAGGQNHGTALRIGTLDSQAVQICSANNNVITTSSSDLTIGVTSTSRVTMQGDLVLAGVATFSTTGTSNNVATVATHVFQYTGAGVATVTGFASGATGRLLYVYNSSGSDLTIANNNAGSTAANRIITPTGADYVVANNRGVTLVYLSSLWRIIANA